MHSRGSTATPTHRQQRQPAPLPQHSRLPPPLRASVSATLPGLLASPLLPPQKPAICRQKARGTLRERRAAQLADFMDKRGIRPATSGGPWQVTPDIPATRLPLGLQPPSCSRLVRVASLELLLDFLAHDSMLSLKKGSWAAGRVCTWQHKASEGREWQVSTILLAQVGPANTCLSMSGCSCAELKVPGRCGTPTILTHRLSSSTCTEATGEDQIFLQSSGII